MTTLADSLVSSSARQAADPPAAGSAARSGSAITAAATGWSRTRSGLHYFRFQEEEYAILQMLDGETSLDEIKERFEAEFPPQKITLEELQQFLGMLHRSGLILAGVQGQGEQLLKRRRERRRKEMLGALANILCIRFKGIDPERLLELALSQGPLVLHARRRWRCACCWCLSALLAGRWCSSTSSARSCPSSTSSSARPTRFWLAMTLGVTKVLHEFGHGLSCKHFGGECHEMGVMILVLTPCLYCNVSDSWMLPNKWHRAAIGAAGMYVEVVLASICTFLWWFSEPGLLNHLCLNVMFVCSVSTIVFNANPLLRYDGYYILADLMEIPNLRQKATTILNRKMGEWCLGLEPPEDPFLPERNQIFFALYSVAAAIYRWVVVFSILWFLYQIFKPYRLEVIGQVILVASLWGLLVQPLYQLGKFFYVPGRLDKVKKPRMYASVGRAAVLIIAFLLFVPLPYSVMSTAEVQARDAESVYVDVPGMLATIRVRPGDRVDKGDVLAELVSTADSISRSSRCCGETNH